MFPLTYVFANICCRRAHTLSLALPLLPAKGIEDEDTLQAAMVSATEKLMIKVPVSLGQACLLCGANIGVRINRDYREHRCYVDMQKGELEELLKNKDCVFRTAKDLSGDARQQVTLTAVQEEEEEEEDKEDDDEEEGRPSKRSRESRD